MNALSVLGLMPSKRNEVSNFLSLVLAEVKAGNINPLQLRVNIKAIETLCDEINNATKDLQLREAMKYGKSFEFSGAKVEQAELASRYEYSECNDVELVELQKQADEIQERLKDRKKFLQTLSKPIEQVSTETGEVYNILPATKKSTTGLKITLL